MRLTCNQQTVLETLQRMHKPISAYDLLKRLHTSGFNAPTQVYRALDRLLEHGLAHRLESLNAYVACSHPHASEHAAPAFAICEECGCVDEVTESDINQSLALWAKYNNFALGHSIIELHGRCANCAGTDSPL